MQHRSTEDSPRFSGAAAVRRFACRPPVDSKRRRSRSSRREKSSPCARAARTGPRISRPRPGEACRRAVNRHSTIAAGSAVRRGRRGPLRRDPRGADSQRPAHRRQRSADRRACAGRRRHARDEQRGRVRTRPGSEGRQLADGVLTRCPLPPGRSPVETAPACDVAARVRSPSVRAGPVAVETPPACDPAGPVVLKKRITKPRQASRSRRSGTSCAGHRRNARRTCPPASRVRRPSSALCPPRIRYLPGSASRPSRGWLR